MSNTRFNIGDKVKVREDLKSSQYYGGIIFISDMKKYAGKVLTIKDKGNFLGHSHYTIEEDSQYYMWTDEMLTIPDRYEDVWEDGDIVITTNGKCYLLWSKETELLVRKDGYYCHKDNKEVGTKFEVLAIYAPNKKVGGFTLYDLVKATGKLKWFKGKGSNLKKEMTIKEIEEKLGYSIKVVKE